MPLDSFDVAFAPHAQAALLMVKDMPEEASRWSLYDIEAHPGYKAALVIEGAGHKLLYLHWTSERC